MNVQTALPLMFALVFSFNFGCHQQVQLQQQSDAAQDSAPSTSQTSEPGQEDERRTSPQEPVGVSSGISEAIVCQVSYEGEGSTEQRNIRFDTSHQTETIAFADLQFVGRYWPPLEEGNSFKVWVGSPGQSHTTPFEMLYQFQGNSITELSLGNDGFTGLNRIFHPTSGSTLEYSCSKDGVRPTNLAAPTAPAPRIECHSAFRRSNTVGIETSRDIDVSSTEPQNRSPFFRILEFRMDYSHGADPRELVLSGHSGTSTDPSFEIHYRFDNSLPSDVFSGGHGFTGLGYMRHTNGAEMQFFCSPSVN